MQRNLKSTCPGTRKCPRFEARFRCKRAGYQNWSNGLDAEKRAKPDLGVTLRFLLRGTSTHTACRCVARARGVYGHYWPRVDITVSVLNSCSVSPKFAESTASLLLAARGLDTVQNIHIDEGYIEGGQTDTKPQTTTRGTEKRNRKRNVWLTPHTSSQRSLLVHSSHKSIFLASVGSNQCERLSSDIS